MPLKTDHGRDRTPDPLRSLEILDTASEEAFDRLTRLAAKALHAPLAVTSLVDEARVWLKSKVGTSVTQSTREDSFCTHTVEQQEVFVVKDARLDPRFVYSPLVTELGVRFYAGAPIALATGAVVGAVCVLDTVPRDAPSGTGIALLQGLAAAAGHLLDLRRELIGRRVVECKLAEHARLLGLAEEMAGVGHWRLDFATGDLHLSPTILGIYGLDRAAGTPDVDTLLALYDPADRARIEQHIEDARNTGRGYSCDARLRRADNGEVRHVRVTAQVESGLAGERVALIGVFRDVTVEMKAIERLDERLLDADRRANRLNHLASTDALTGLPNRRAFLLRAGEIFSTGTEVSLAILDIDYFKAINDRFGHDAGDAALAAFGRICLRVAADDCLFGRIGGEEFAMLMIGKDEVEAAATVAHLRRAVTDSLVSTPCDARFRLTFSAGLAQARPGDEWQTLFARSDAALYEAKTAGRDRVAIAA